MNNRRTKYSGSCLCGEINFEVDEFETPLGHCHCKMCQKFHGAAFSTLAEVKLENLYWITGQKNLKSYTAANNTIRQFCNTCGSSLLFCSPHNQKSATIELAIACLDNDCNLKPDAHIYTSSKASWITIGDELPQHKEFREGK